MIVTAVFALLAVHLSFAEGGCVETYSQWRKYYTTKRHLETCWGWFKCSYYTKSSYQRSTLGYRCCTNWQGSDCSIPVCHGSTLCPNGGTCQSPNQCSCITGFASPTCSEINECERNNGDCEQICTNTHGSFECSCRSGYIMNPDQKTCFEVNECNTDNGDCQQECKNLQGSFRCDCQDGYTLNTDGKTCTDTDECREEAPVCQHNCTNTVGSFTCSCLRGYNLDLDHTSCIDEDECINNNVCDHRCQNTEGSYTCSCNDGYSLQPDGYSCSDNDECETNNGNCQDACENIPGSYTCICLSGFVVSADGQTCEDIDECARGIAGCSHGCSNTIGSFVCSCPQGFRLASSNTTCDDIDDCEGTECYNGGTCIDAIMSFSCRCMEGYTGRVCEIDIDECSFFNGGCHDTCLNTDGSFHCICNNNRTISSNGISCEGASPSETVFEKHNIIGKVLPRGCWTIGLAKCEDGKELNITLSSTSEWLLLDSAQKTTFSYGIVFLEVNNIAIPISIEGIEVHESPENFQLLIGVKDEYKGRGSLTGNVIPDNCWSFNFSKSDKFEFIEAGSFMNSVFISIIASLPNWVQFKSTNTSVLNVRDLKTDLVYGIDINNDNWCKGAPVFSDHLYSVFRFGSSFAMEIYGQSINLSTPLSGEKFCLIVDICQSFGETVFLMLPRESRSLFSKDGSFGYFFRKAGFHIEPIGIGISLVNGINVQYDKTELALWNGDAFFTYPIPKHDSFWIGGEFRYNTTAPFSQLHVEGNADVFLSIPKVNRLLTAVFIDEWSGHLSVKSPEVVLKFKLFERIFVIPLNAFVTGRLDTYMSIGGQQERTLCGSTANPPGIFLSTMVKINPFLNVPILEDWVFDDTRTVYAFVMSDPRSSLHTVDAIDVEKDILDLQGALERIGDFLLDIFNDIKYILFSNIRILIQKVTVSTNNVVDTVRQCMPEIRKGNLNRIVDIVGEIWKGLKVVFTDVRIFLNSVELRVDDFYNNVTHVVQTESQIVKENFNRIQQRLQQQVSNLIKDYDGFGFKYHAAIKIFGLKISGLDVELVYSKRRLLYCSRFDSVYKLLDGKDAARFIVRVSSEIRLGFFLKIEIGAGFGMAFAMDFEEIAVQLEVFANILGVQFTADLFITNKGLAFYREINVWNIFLAQVDVIAEHGKDWYDLTYQVRGRFVAQARKKRQIQTPYQSFQSSYLDSLKRVVRVKTDEAQNRLNNAQNAISDAQTVLMQIQQLLEEKEQDFRRANVAFDDAVESLENTKYNLEEAKQSYDDAIDELETAQKNIDNVCKIMKCGTICIPGLKCQTCKKSFWGRTIRYPCCHFTNCLYSSPEPLCVLANVACQALIDFVYYALDGAKLIVEAVKLVYDAAKSAVSVAQVVVDKSRKVLDLAEGVVELARIGLKGAEDVLEKAKATLEFIKITLEVVAKMLEFVIEFGLKDVIDVGNCHFEIELSTTDSPVFEISCDVKAFQLDVIPFLVRINFKNVFQSMWHAAKATIESIIKLWNEKLMDGRQRRATLFSSASIVHRFLRKARSADTEGINTTSQSAYDLIDTLVYNDGFDTHTFSDFDNRVYLYRKKCVDIVNVISFLNETFSILFEVANETHVGIRESLLAKSQIPQFNITDMANNMTLQSTGINAERAMQEFNFSETDLEIVLEASRNNTATDSMINEIYSIIELSSKSIDSELSAAESVQILNQWLSVMENTTNDYFNDSECYKFKDCVYHSIALLYDLYTEESHPEMITIQAAITSLEDYILDVFQNSTSSISDTFNASASIMAKIHLLSRLNLFCSKAPVFTVDMKNKTAVVGSSAVFRCNVYSEPAAAFWWYKDGDYIPDSDIDMLTVENVTTEDAAVYQCVAGNIVANITSDEVHLIVITSLEVSEENRPDDSVMTIVLLVTGVVLTVVVITTAATFVPRFIRSRYPNRVEPERLSNVAENQSL